MVLPAPADPDSERVPASARRTEGVAGGRQPPTLVASDRAEQYGGGGCCWSTWFVYVLLESALGPLTLGVNPAGIASAAPAESMPEDQWRQVIDVDLTGVFLSARPRDRR